MNHEHKLLLDELKKFNIQISNNYINLDDLMTKILEIKCKDLFISNINEKNIKKIKGDNYISLETCINLLHKTNKTNGKNIVKHINTSIISLDNSRFNFKGLLVTIININNIIWFRGRDVAIILGYRDTANAINKHVTEKNKKTYLNLQKLGLDKLPSPSFCDDVKTMYINESGLYQLIMKSKMKLAKGFQLWVFDDVLPNIRKYGTYTVHNNTPINKIQNIIKPIEEYIAPNNIPINQIQNIIKPVEEYTVTEKAPIKIVQNIINPLEEEQKKLISSNMYDNMLITDYDNKNICYIGYIGIYNDKLLFKFGISTNVYVRDIKTHRKFYKMFVIKYIKECHNHKQLENKFKQELVARGLTISLKINDVMQNEIFTVNDIYPIDTIIQLFETLIDKYGSGETEKDNDTNYRIKELEFKKFEIQEQTKQIEIRETGKIKQLEIQEKTKQLEIQEKTKHLELQIQLKQYELNILKIQKNMSDITINDIFVGKKK